MSAGDAAVGDLEEQARQRKAKLQALKARRDGSSNKEDEGNGDSKKPLIKFRNYVPTDIDLKTRQVEKAKPEKVEEEVTDQLQGLQEKESVNEVNLTNLAPRKPDWDLKRDIAKKLSRLDKRTQRAIAELTRDRIRAEQGGGDLASAVTAAEEEKNDSDSD